MKLENLPDHSRVWVYQADRFLTQEEVERATIELANFVIGWAAHGAKLNAAAEVVKSLFVVIAVDEHQAAASGCSIDASMAVIKKLEELFNLSFTNRMLVAAQLTNELVILPLQNMTETKVSEAITENTLVYDNLVSNIGDWKKQWVKPIKDSWHSRFL